MKKLTILLAFILVYTFSFSQDNLKQIIKKDNSNDIVEKYFVLKTDKKIIQGKYKRFMDNDLIAEGQYSNNKKSGNWKFYGYNGKLELEYNYDSNIVVSYDQNQLIDTLDRPVILLGSSIEPRRYIQMNLRYPVDAQENNKSGRIIISILIDENGKIYGYEIKQKIYPSLDNAALEAVKKIIGEWLPAIYKGKNIKSRFDIPVIFQLS